MSMVCARPWPGSPTSDGCSSSRALRASDSSNLRNAGVRFWAIPEVLGLDVVTTRSASGGLTVSVGFGWYGIRLQ